MPHQLVLHRAYCIAVGEWMRLCESPGFSIRMGLRSNHRSWTANVFLPQSPHLHREVRCQFAEMVRGKSQKPGSSLLPNNAKPAGALKSSPLLALSPRRLFVSPFSKICAGRVLPKRKFGCYPPWLAVSKSRPSSHHGRAAPLGTGRP